MDRENEGWREVRLKGTAFVSVTKKKSNMTIFLRYLCDSPIWIKYWCFAAAAIPLFAQFTSGGVLLVRLLSLAVVVVTFATVTAVFIKKMK